jgi:NAD(P)H dehydrogenase (quinone)
VIVRHRPGLMIDGFNEGWIDFERAGAEHRRGQIPLEAVLKDLSA